MRNALVHKQLHKSVLHNPIMLPDELELINGGVGELEVAGCCFPVGERKWEFGYLWFGFESIQRVLV